MVAPIYLIAIALGVAFFTGFFHKSKSIPAFLLLAGLGSMTFISIQWLIEFLINNRATELIYTAGFKPPFSISLSMGKYEAAFTAMINGVGLLSAIYMLKQLREKGANSMMIYIVFIMGLNVMVMTRDLFNLFVFMEIASIAVAGLLLLDTNKKSMSAGFKYLIATGVIAGLLLLGIIFIYYFTGSLNIDDILAVDLYAVKGGAVAIFFLLMAIVLELKPFPANGWGLDVYEGARPGLAALISAASATAGIYVLYKISGTASTEMYSVLTTIGLITFLGSNLLGIKQNNAQRLLGYSSIGQMGLLIAVIGLSQFIGKQFGYILMGILLSHYFAKAGLFWLAGIIKKSNIKDWGVIRKSSLMLFFMGTFVFALVGMPPFPSFFAKWELITALADANQYFYIAVILVGSFLEGVYLFRWFGYAVKKETEETFSLNIDFLKFIPVAIFSVAVYVFGYYFGQHNEYANAINYIPLLFAALLFALDFLPVFIKNILTISGLGYYYYTIYPGLEGLNLVFASIFIIGGILIYLAGFAKKGTRPGFYPLSLLMYSGLALMLEADNMLEFFFAWEMMTAGSYFLIIRGKKSMKHALSYILFSVGGAYLIFAGFAAAQAGQVGLSIGLLQNVSEGIAPAVFSLLVVGFMTKTASLGLHIWLPGAHAEAETDVSPMVSAILLKAGIFGLIMVMMNMGDQMIGNTSITYYLGWIGVFTSLIGNLMAAMQEDAKRLLAYSSIGQLGYALFGLSLMSHLGWLVAVALVVTHFLFKTVLFLSIGGVVMRTKTKLMYKMGGLVKKMPLTYIASLMAIITLAGIPPLNGFAGKWLFYNAIIEKEWFLQGGVLFFAGIIAFLYCYRFLHTVFHGQLKDEHREVKEAPFWILLPQYLILITIMVLSMFPNSLLQPIGEMLKSIYPQGALVWEDTLAHSLYGYWDGKLVMYIVMAIFGSVFFWALFVNRKAQKVKQFNITYSGEAPSRPETTHYAYNFFAPYKKALGFLMYPGITNFWNGVAEYTHAVADKVRRIYNGNGQSYVFHIVAFIVVFYFISVGGGL